MILVTTERIAGRSLVDPSLFGRLVARIVKDEKLETALAEQVMDQALAFLGACAQRPAIGLGPSALVDIGWHTFILHTREYSEFCNNIAGRFMHHVPTDEESPGNGTTIADTVTVMRECGFLVDDALWAMCAADCEFDKKCGNGCSQCQKGCSDGNVV
ncbi:glycine-rich domain-containing protein [Streptomyces kaniharaensis]|uniref:glycine-rich domain-containing protein n=1 Tax=Streptomyces kaniharaensis TaxID=212423 RepID=UPI0018A8224B|nr:hypothetical protein [Streptomyces kaniharaensis]